MTPPIWALSFSYAFHMLATITWVGSLAVMQALLLPLFSRILDRRARFYSFFLTQRRLEAPTWFSVLILMGTGLFQMSAHPQYNGFLTINNLWSFAILVKHLFIVIMVAINAYQSWVLLPTANRLLYKKKAALHDFPALGKTTFLDALPETWFELVRGSHRLMRINLILGALVLLMTAIARAAS